MKATYGTLDDADDGDGRVPPTTLRANKLCWTVETSGTKRELLSDVSARFSPGTITALVGPSGAGKTSLLMALAGRLQGDHRGAILVNDVAATASERSRLSSLMPQDDRLFESLTVEETLLYAARLKLRVNREGRASRVRSVLKALGLTDVHKEVIKNVSGGQRRRTSAAIELLSKRPLLLLDEPTSGLDSFASYNLVQLLKQTTAREQRTCIATVHQPASQLLALFDSILILAPGGRLAFEGTPSELDAFFLDRKMPLPTNETAPDHAINVVLRTPDKRTYRSPRKAPTTSGEMPCIEDGSDLSTQYLVLLHRQCKIWTSDPDQGRLMVLMVLAQALWLGLLATGMTPCISKGNLIQVYAGAILMASANWLCVSLPLERPVVLREYRNGSYGVVAYFLARVTLCCIVALIAALASMAVFYILLQTRWSPVAVPDKWLWATFLLSACSNFLGLCVGFLVDSPLDALGAIPTLQLVMMQSTGFGPPQNQMQPYVKPLRYPNLLHWSNKIFLTLNFHHTNEKGTKVLKMYDIRTGQVTACFQALLLCFLVTLFLAGCACYRSLTKQRRSGRERGPSKSRSEVEQDAASSIRRLFEGSPPPSSDDDYPDDDLSQVPSTRAPSIKCVNLTTSYGSGSTLMDLSCEFEGSTCLMGPSGAGKTSLLNALSGRAQHNVVRGYVLIDGAEPSSSIVQLTPQEDTLLAGLTVEQTFRYASLLYSDREDAIERADALVDALGLKARRHLVVGNALAPGGLSGGQRKRVSIGIDMLAEKPVMLIDEPTTGLDASAARHVGRMVVSLSKKYSRTVVCTLHQPAWSIVERFDRVVLLSRGRCCFAGPPHHLHDFFSALGLQCPPATNLADHALHVLSSSPDVAARCADRLQAVKDAPVVQQHTLSRVSPIRQAFILTKRTASVYAYSPDQLGLCVHASIMNALVAGLVYRAWPMDLWIGFGACLGGMGMSMSCAMTSILALPTERPFVSREYANGTYTAGSYWCARCVVCFGVCTLVGLLTTPIWYFLIGVSMGPQLLVIMIASILAAFAFTTYANIVGALSSTPIAAANFAEPLLTAMLLLNGIMITRHKIKSLFYPFYLINPQSWLCYIIVEAVTKGHPRGDHVMDYFQYKKGNVGASFCALLAIDAGAVLLGWAVLTHAFAAEVDGSELSVVEKVATCGIADDAEDDDFVRKPPREEDGEVCLPVGIC